MVEQTDACECHCDIVLVAGLDNVVVADRAAGLCDVLNAGLLCSLDVLLPVKPVQLKTGPTPGLAALLPIMLLLSGLDLTNLDSHLV